jgi:outer membrane protein with beta-barrel domain
MSKRTTELSLCAAVVLVGSVAAPTAAQTRTVEVSARYQALYDWSIEERFPVGWSGDVAANIDDSWGIVAEVGGMYRSDTNLDVDLNLFTFGSGARWSGRRTSRVSPFAQLVLGWARMGSSANIAGGQIRVSQTKLMLQPAAGVNVAVSDALGIVGQAGYRRIFLDRDQDGDTGFNELSISVGVRFGF